jgi:hypothetical protein
LVLDASGSAARLVSRWYAWLVVLMVMAPAATDSIDRQIVVSAFPCLKKAWRLSDVALVALVPVVSIAMAVLTLPTTRLASGEVDRGEGRGGTRVRPHGHLRAALRGAAPARGGRGRLRTGQT